VARCASQFAVATFLGFSTWATNPVCADILLVDEQWASVETSGGVRVSQVDTLEQAMQLTPRRAVTAR